MKRQHLLAAHVLLRLAGRRSSDPGDVPTLEERYKFLMFTSSFELPLLTI